MDLSQKLPSRQGVWFPRSLLQLIRYSGRRTFHLAVASWLISWVPPALFSAVHSASALASFLTDYAAQSRLLFVIPLLILTEPAMVAGLEAIARHFREEHMVRVDDQPRFESLLASFERGDSVAVRIVLALLALAITVPAVSSVSATSLMPWCYAAAPQGTLSLAGWWYIVVSFSILLFVLFRWLWRQLLWLRFLGAVTSMDLQLVAAHPDRAAGLSFLELSLRGFMPFGLAIGTIVAGGVANRVVHLHQSLEGFSYLPLIVVAIVAVTCVGPLCVFVGTLVQARQQGIFRYGTLASSLGRHFERKWLAMTDKVAENILEAPDFSATIDLYSVVGNVQQMNAVPFGLRSVSRLIALSLAPALPLALIALPFEVFAQDVMKFLL